MSRSTRRFLALAALTAAVAAPSASAYPDSYRQEFSVSSGLAAKMRIEDGQTAQAHGGPRFLIEGPAQVSAPVTASAALDAARSTSRPCWSGSPSVRRSPGERLHCCSPATLDGQSAFKGEGVGVAAARHP